MVVKMMKWPPWPPSIVSKKFLVKLAVVGLHGLINFSGRDSDRSRIIAEVRWKGPKSTLSNLRKSNRTNLTKVAPLIVQEEEEEIQKVVEEEGKNWVAKVEWNEEFHSVCTLTSNNIQKPNLHPWEITFLVSNGPTLSDGQRMNKATDIGAASLNLAEYASTPENKETEIRVPLQSKSARSTIKPVLHLHLVLSISEIKGAETSSEIIGNELAPIPSTPPPVDKCEVSFSLKAGLRKVNIFRDFLLKSKKTGLHSERSYEMDYMDDDDDDVARGDATESIGYESLASANYIGVMMWYEMRSNEDFDSWVYYSRQRSPYMDWLRSNMEKTSVVEFIPASSSSLFSFSSSAKSLGQSLLPWKRKRLYLLCSECEGEPLLKDSDDKCGGDMDVDMDQGGKDTIFEFVEWETKEIISRDSSMKLRSQMFFASIDQRSERASGESACTALVAVLANWLNTNLYRIPLKSKFDSLIREGSLEWRRLCKNKLYSGQFPDKHFDLETVLQAKIRPLSVAPSKSFVGFFCPEEEQEEEDEGSNDDHINDHNSNNNNGLELFDGLMSFDNVWDEISQAASTLNTPENLQKLYIVSWNDHFFILVVKYDAYYIIDTLGERLYEGCKQAYILKFDECTTITKIPPPPPVTGDASNEKPKKTNKNKDKIDSSTTLSSEGGGEEEDDKIVCRGKETCKEYIKAFLAAIPISSVRADMKKGVMLFSIYQRLQIEFHYTELSPEIP